MVCLLTWAVAHLLTRQVVAFCAYSSDLPRILNITKRVMDDAGVDFYSYTWMDLGSTEVTAVTMHYP
jgi:hypothetical protein